MAGAGDGADGTDADIGVDYLFHVAGGSQHAAAEDTADEVDRDMFELNTMSAIALTKALLPVDARAQEGKHRRHRIHGGQVPRTGTGHLRGDQGGAVRACHFAAAARLRIGACPDQAPGPIATGLGGQTRVIFGATLAKSTCDTAADAAAAADAADPTRAPRLARRRGD